MKTFWLFHGVWIEAGDQLGAAGEERMLFRTGEVAAGGREVWKLESTGLGI